MKENEKNGEDGCRRMNSRIFYGLLHKQKQPRRQGEKTEPWLKRRNECDGIEEVGGGELNHTNDTTYQYIQALLPKVSRRHQTVVTATNHNYIILALFRSHPRPRCWMITPPTVGKKKGLIQEHTSTRSRIITR